jgi:hypothetical protein
MKIKKMIFLNGKVNLFDSKESNPCPKTAPFSSLGVTKKKKKSFKDKIQYVIFILILFISLVFGLEGYKTVASDINLFIEGFLITKGRTLRMIYGMVSFRCLLLIISARTKNLTVFLILVYLIVFLSLGEILFLDEYAKIVLEQAKTNNGPCS